MIKKVGLTKNGGKKNQRAVKRSAMKRHGAMMNLGA